MSYVRHVAFTLLFVTVSAFEKDILIAIGVSVVGTLLFCLVLSLLLWRFCMRDSDPTKHQFDPELIVNPYSYESTNGEVCSSCGSRIDKYLKDVPEERKESEQKKAEEVIVMIHSNTSTAPPSESVAPEQNIHRLQPDNLSFMVHLIKTDTGSLGLSIVGGRSSRLGDIGIFIKSILQDSPAEHNGQLKPWDQILVVNDRSFDGITIHEALAILKSIRDEVYLTILPSEIATAKLEASLKKSGTILEDEEDTKGVDDVDTPRGKRPYGRSTAEISYAETERYFPDEDEDVFANSETLSDLSHDLTPMYGTPVPVRIQATNGITVNSSPDILVSNNEGLRKKDILVSKPSNPEPERNTLKEEVIAVMVHDPPKQVEPSSTPRTSAHLRDFTLECEEEDLEDTSLYNCTPDETPKVDIPVVEVNEKSIIEFEEGKYSADEIRIRYNNETAVVCNGNT